MSAHEADNAYNEPLNYKEPAEQEPYIDTIMDEIMEPPVAQPQETPSILPSTVYSCTSDRLVTYRHYTVPDHPIQGTNTVYRTIRVHGAPRIRECDTKLGRMHHWQLLGLLDPPGGFGRCCA